MAKNLKGAADKRDRQFLSKEDHEQKYKSKRKKPYKQYKKREKANVIS